MARSRFAAFFCFALRVVALPILENLQDGDVIPGSYIVTLKKNLEQENVENHLQWLSDVHRRSLSRRDTAGLEKTYEIGTFHAYSGEFDEDAINEISENSDVLSVEPNRAVIATTLVNQTDAPWGIASLTGEVYSGEPMGHAYVHHEDAGKGTWAYVFDTGVFVEHPEFEGRAIKGYNAWADEEEHVDNFGHGSHVAGTIASKTYGIAKKATVVDVKILRGVGYGTIARALDGIEWAVNNITNTPGRSAKSVLNFSVAFPKSEALNSGIDAAYEAGVLSVAGAANDGADASGKSPASAELAYTVGAVDWTKTRAEWSNFGPLVNIFAPGVGVASIWRIETDQPSVIDGTSMATPHVTGLVAYLKSLELLETPAATIKRVEELALKGAVKDPAGSANVLAYLGDLIKA